MTFITSLAHYILQNPLATTTIVVIGFIVVAGMGINWVAKRIKANL